MSSITRETLVEETGISEATGSMQLVSFRLAEEEYGIEITKIREIILIAEITRIPQTPHYVKGLTNLRSTVIPVVDAVNEVLRISHEQIAPPPPTVAGLGQEYLTGLVKLEECLLILLDVDKILGQEATEVLKTAMAGT